MTNEKLMQTERVQKLVLAYRDYLEPTQRVLDIMDQRNSAKINMISNTILELLQLELNECLDKHEVSTSFGKYKDVIQEADFITDASYNNFVKNLQESANARKLAT